MTNIKYEEFGRQVRSGDSELARAIQQLPDYREQQRNYFASSLQISRGVRGAQSIDNFVNLHDDNVFVVRIAKLAIARALLQAENRSRLFAKSRSTPNPVIVEIPFDSKTGIDPRQTWYQTFFEIASEGVSKQDLDLLFKEVKVVSFNYDGTLELFLINRVSDLYAVDVKSASKIVEQLEIVRPYGSLGELPQMSRTSRGVDFGADTDRTSLITVSEQLKTYSEFVGSDTQQALQNMLSAKCRLVFLGCPYHKQNLELFGPHSITDLEILGTALGVSEPNKEAYVERLNIEVRRRPGNTTLRASRDAQLFDASCHKLMQDWKERLKD